MMQKYFLKVLRGESVINYECVWLCLGLWWKHRFEGGGKGLQSGGEVVEHKSAHLLLYISLPAAAE